MAKHVALAAVVGSSFEYSTIDFTLNSAKDYKVYFSCVQFGADSQLQATMSRFRLESDGDAVMTVPQPIFEVVLPPKLEAWDQASLITWRRAREQYEETVKERCQWSGEDYKLVVRGVRTAVDPDLFAFLAAYEIGKDKKDITDEDILAKVKERCETMNSDYLSNPSALFSQQLKMDLTIKDVPDRVAKYFRLFERIIADNGFQENLGRGNATDDNYVARMKQRTKILVENLSPTMLRDEIKGMLELVKYKHIRINDQLLYKLILERAELQQLFYNRFKQQEAASAAPKAGNRKGGRPQANPGAARTESTPRSSNEGGQQPTRGRSGAPASNTAGATSNRRPPPRTGCLHCKGEHWLRDCPTATPAEKEEARAKRSNSWKVKRAVVGKPTTAEDAAQRQAHVGGKALEDEEYSVLINGVVEISMCPDTGAETSILPAMAVEQVRAAGHQLATTRLATSVPVIGVGGKVTMSHESAQIDLQIRTSAGPVNLYKLECLVVEGEDQFLLSKVVMKRLGIDVKRAFEQLANTSIDLNHDDIPEEPEVGDLIEDEVKMEVERICEEVRSVLTDEQYSDFREDVIQLTKTFMHLYRTRIGPDEPALVEPLTVTMVKGAEPYRCKPRRFPPAQMQFLDEYVAQLVKFGLVKKNNLSKWASHAVPVRKSDAKTDFRATNNYIEVNKRTVPIAGTMPHFSVILSFVAGVKFIAKFDMFKGFWQIMLAEECQEMFSFMTHDGVYTPLRVPQGATDSALHFQNQMQTVYKPLLYKGALIWIDDIIIYGRTEKEFLANLQLFYELTAKYRLKLNAKKSVLMSFEVSWCGRIIDGEGVRQDPERLSGLVSLPLPKTAADLQRFLCACNWIRDSMVDFARTFEPLQSKLNQSLTNRSRTKRSASAVTLTWTEEERGAYSGALQCIAGSAKLYFPEDEATICLMTDASDYGYAIILTQVRDWQEGVLVEDQKHELLICQGGVFRGAQLHWSVVEKEAYPVVRVCVSLDYILEREGGFKAFCDHSNLIQIFSPSESVMKHTRGKLLRWALRISCLRYTIEHIDGERNLWADIVSRWKPGNAEIGPATMLVKVARIADLSRIRPLQDDKFTWPTIESVRAAQEAAVSPGAEFKQNEQGIWVADGKIWLPPNDNDLIVRVMIVAHCGVRAHRGAEAMLLLLRDEFVFEDMSKRVEHFVAECLLCKHVKDGLLVQRPWNIPPKATRRNELLHMDFLSMGESYGDMQYVLALKDDLSHYCELIACQNVNGLVAATAVLDGYKRFGLPELWQSDNGSHFRNTLMEDLKARLGALQRFSSNWIPETGYTYFP
ncbi:unnamed protein product [Phytophthora fragariaefolia]|uniref:Unnamed protein product n=1 Tax=Phytophthora fragariaefolia TaxID=1490495 RepID=A0A9W6XHJ5_9STRA|nr:unnamed protein product [Phytophthora fragariaefolia]